MAGVLELPCTTAAVPTAGAVLVVAVTALVLASNLPSFCVRVSTSPARLAAKLAFALIWLRKSSSTVLSVLLAVAVLLKLELPRLMP